MLALTSPSELDCSAWLFHRIENHRVIYARGRFGTTGEVHSAGVIASLCLIWCGQLLTVDVLGLIQFELYGRFKS